MRVLVTLACLCAAAYAQTQSYEIAAASGNFDKAYDNYEYTSTTNGYGNNELDEVPKGGSISTITPELRARYRTATDQYDEESAPVSNRRCIEKNERYSIPGSCDRYIECLNGTAEEKLCPDGLRYNPNVKFNVDPCQYPIDVPCLGRSSLQPAQPTDNCPHQFGYFKIGDARNCSGFRNCVNGVGYEFSCPEGLAFSPSTYRCEWPDEVKECDVEAFLGFSCPEIPISKELGPPAGYRHYRSPSNCQKYFICINGKPRQLSCSGYSGFDEQTEACVAADEISACPVELRNRATKSREEEKQRATAEESLKKLKSGYKSQRANYISTTEQSYYRTTEESEFQEVSTNNPQLV